MDESKKSRRHCREVKQVCVCVGGVCLYGMGRETTDLNIMSLLGTFSFSLLCLPLKNFPLLSQFIQPYF